MPTRNVVLSDHQSELVESLVQCGRYQKASEVLRDGLRPVERREAEDAAKLETLRSASQQGWDDVDNDRYTDIPDDDLESFVRQLGARSTDR